MGGDSTLEESHALTVDKQGNTYYTGNFKDTVDFDPGSGIYNLNTSPNALYEGCPFVSKLDASGNFVWAKSFTDTSANGGHGACYGIVTDDSGNVYTTGQFWGSIDFDPGSGTFVLPFTGSGDCFISKLDKFGNFVWAKKYANPSQYVGETGGIIQLDAIGNIYVVVGLYFSFQGDAVLLKLNPSGNLIWSKTFSGNGNNGVTNLLFTNDGHIYLAGLFQTFISLPPFTLTGMGNMDMYFSKLDTSGNFLWVKQIGGHHDVRGSDIAFDSSLNIYITGTFDDTTDFDPGPGVYDMFTHSGVYKNDVFISKYDSAGNFVWAKSIGGNSYDQGIILDLDSSANIYSAGHFRDTVDFDPGPGAYLMTSTTLSDIYFWKLDSSGNFIWAKQLPASFNACGQCFALDKATSIYSTGRFSGTTDFDMGAGVFNLTAAGTADIFIHKFRQCTPSNGTDIITACDSITWLDGNTYTISTNTPVFTIIGGSATNCDSIITLDLTITHSTFATDSITACKSFTWIDGNTYTSSNNTATHILTNSAGCDSLVTLNLTINNADTAVLIDSTTATLIADSAASSYQWLDCNNNYSVINGATSQSFTPAQNGIYAVAITQNGCTDTSACFPVLNVGITEEYSFVYFSIYPNPTNGMFSITVNGLQQTQNRIEVYNTNSQKVFSENISSNKINIDLSHQPDGIYLVMLKTKDESFSKKIIVRN